MLLYRMARGGLFICDQVMLEQELKEVGRKSQLSGESAHQAEGAASTKA